MINDGGRGSNSGGVGAGQTLAAHGYISLYLRGVISQKSSLYMRAIFSEKNLSLYKQAQKAYRRKCRLIEAF